VLVQRKLVCAPRERVFFVLSSIIYTLYSISLVSFFLTFAVDESNVMCVIPVSSTRVCTGM
jgi:hypothetical protein